MGNDRWVKCISTQGHIRGVAIHAENLIETQAKLHQLKGDAICRLGEVLMAGLLVSSYCKKGERINLNIQGNGAFKHALVDAYPDAKVRGYLIQGEPADFLPTDVGPWGSGTLAVLKTKDREGEKPYIGTVPLLTGHLAKDLSFYWVQSEQIPSAVGLAVNIENDRVVSAGGFLVQVMPGASVDDVKLIEQHILDMESLAKSLGQTKNPTQLLSQIFQSTPFMVVEEKPIESTCSCSWERVERALVLVGPEELRAMLNTEETSWVRCDFCTKEFEIEKALLLKLLERFDPEART